MSQITALQGIIERAQTVSGLDGIAIGPPTAVFELTMLFVLLRINPAETQGFSGWSGDATLHLLAPFQDTTPNIPEGASLPHVFWNPREEAFQNIYRALIDAFKTSAGNTTPATLNNKIKGMALVTPTNDPGPLYVINDVPHRSATINLHIEDKD